MTKREAQRIVRRALKMTGMSPEAFAVRYAAPLYRTSARTVRRWADGETVPHGAILAWMQDAFASTIKGAA